MRRITRDLGIIEALLRNGIGSEQLLRPIEIEIRLVGIGLGPIQRRRRGVDLRL